jgi:hypothetical protein
VGCQSGKTHSTRLLLFRQTGTGEFLVHPECLGTCWHALVRSNIATNTRACLAKAALADTLRRCGRIRNTCCARVCTHFATPPGCEEREERVRKTDGGRFHDAGSHVAARAPGRKSCTLQNLNVANLGAVDQVSDIPRHCVAAQGCCEMPRTSARRCMRPARGAPRPAQPRAKGVHLLVRARALGRAPCSPDCALPACTASAALQGREHSDAGETVYLLPQTPGKTHAAGEGTRRRADAHRGERTDARTHGKMRAPHATLGATRVRWTDAHRAGKLTSHAGAHAHHQHHRQACAAGSARQRRCPPMPQAAVPPRGHGCRRHCVRRLPAFTDGLPRTDVRQLSGARAGEDEAWGGGAASATPRYLPTCGPRYPRRPVGVLRVCTAAQSRSHFAPDLALSPPGPNSPCRPARSSARAPSTSA